MRRSNLSRTVVGMAAVVTLICGLSRSAETDERRARARDIGIEVGVMEPGILNAITDVAGVLVGHRTLSRGTNIRTGVTAILPHGGNLFLEKVPAGIAVGNGFGKLAGGTQLEELGDIETPIVLTNTLAVGTAMTAVVRHTLAMPGNETARSVNSVVAETNDGWLNDIRGMHVTEEDVLAAIRSAAGGIVEEGAVGAGTGTIAFGFKGGIGTASRIVPRPKPGESTAAARYTVGVLVQTNFGGILDVNGAPVGRELAGRRRHATERDAAPPPRPDSTQTRGGANEAPGRSGGSCMIVIATDAPLSPRNIERLARRAFLGLARTGSYMSNGTGDYAIAFSTAYRVPHDAPELVAAPPLVSNEAMTPLFQAVVEATQEAVYNSLFMAATVQGQGGRVAEAIPIEDVLEICRRYNALNLRGRFGG